VHYGLTARKVNRPDTAGVPPAQPVQGQAAPSARRACDRGTGRTAAGRGRRISGSTEDLRHGSSQQSFGTTDADMSDDDIGEKHGIFALKRDEAGSWWTQPV